MAEASHRHGFVLHVHEQDSPWSRAVSEALGGTPVEVETRLDVYAALALLLGHRGVPCRGLFICLDWLDERDHVFFDLAGRHLGPIPVWAYANRRPVVELAQPLRSQRVRLLEDEGQLALICSQFLQHHRSVPSPRSGRGGAGGAVSPSQESRTNERSSEVSSGAIPSDPVPPVPWLSNPNRPTRTPPGASGSSGSASSASSPARRTESILTREELDALTSDAGPADGRALRSQP